MVPDKVEERQTSSQIELTTETTVEPKDKTDRSDTDELTCKIRRIFNEKALELSSLDRCILESLKKLNQDQRQRSRYTFVEDT